MASPRKSEKEPVVLLDWRPTPEKTPVLIERAESHLATVDEKEEYQQAVLDEKLVARAPDGGYGWVIVVASFFCNFIVDGVAYSFGVLLMEWTTAFPESGEDTISWIGSLLTGVYLCMGPVSSALTNTFGFRAVIFSGTFLAAFAFFASAFCSTVGALIGFFGILGGIGFGLIYSPSILCVCYYFEKRRALAVGISVCGSGAGGLIFPPLVEMMIVRFGWPGTMMILAGLVLQICVAGAFMKTLQVPASAVEELVAETESKGRLLSGVVNENHSGMDTEPDTTELGSQKVPTNRYLSALGLDIGKAHSTDDSGTSDRRRYSSTPDIAQGPHHAEFARPFDRKDILSQGSHKHLDMVGHDVPVLAAIQSPSKRKFALPDPLRDALRELTDVSIYTNPVFLVFSLASFLGMMAFYIPFAFLPKFAVMNYAADKATSTILISVMNGTNMLGRLFWGWLSDRPRADPLLIHNCCMLIVGIVLGFIPLVGDVGDIATLGFLCCLFGFFVAPFISLLSIILTSRIPLEKLPSAFGQSQLVRGIASMIGAPIGATLYEVWKSYTVTFYVSSAECVLTALIASAILFAELGRRRGVYRKRRAMDIPAREAFALSV